MFPRLHLPRSPLYPCGRSMGSLCSHFVLPFCNIWHNWYWQLSFVFVFCLCHTSRNILVLHQESNLCSLQQEHGVLTSGPQGIPEAFFFVKDFHFWPSGFYLLPLSCLGPLILLGSRCYSAQIYLHIQRRNPLNASILSQLWDSALAILLLEFSSPHLYLAFSAFKSQMKF